MYQLKSKSGYTLIELVMIIVIIGILSTVAMRKMSGNIETARYEQTKKELDHLAFAICGNPDSYQSGARIDFGYVGDIGAMPPNLEALVTNPGLGTWEGPYMTNGTGGNDYKTDAWNVDYVYADTLLRSTGSGMNIDKLVAFNTDELLSNSVAGYIVDADLASPGLVYKDSLVVMLIYPDGAGSMKSQTVSTNHDGSFILNSIPIGNHTLNVIYIPDNDTLTTMITVLPGRISHVDITFPADLW